MTQPPPDDTSCECNDSGILVMQTFLAEIGGFNIERCDLCQKYETDEDAGHALEELLARHFPERKS